MNSSTDKVKRADSLKKRKAKNPFKQIQHRIEVVHEIYNSVRRYNSDEKNDGLDHQKDSLINHDFSKTYRPQSPQFVPNSNHFSDISPIKKKRGRKPKKQIVDETFEIPSPKKRKRRQKLDDNQQTIVTDTEMVKDE